MLFPYGRLLATRSVMEEIPEAERMAALCRHLSGDWGDVSESDRKRNDRGLDGSDRLFSVYLAADGRKFYIITEWDRSATTILLPEDY